jgi:hypothetical protein
MGEQTARSHPGKDAARSRRLPLDNTLFIDGGAKGQSPWPRRVGDARLTRTSLASAPGPRLIGLGTPPVVGTLDFAQASYVADPVLKEEFVDRARRCPIIEAGPFHYNPGAMMRALTATAVLAIVLSASLVEAQVVRRTQGIRRPDGSTQIRRTETFRPAHGSGGGHHVGHGHDGHHHHGHGGHGYGGHHHHGYGGVYGFGYGLDSIGVYGNGLGYYRGPATWGGINPPVFAYPPYGYGYGYGGYGGYGYSLPPQYGDTAYYLGLRNTYGNGTAWNPAGQPYDRVLQQQKYEADWARLSAELADRALRNVDGPVPGAKTILVPSTPEAKIKASRFEAIGDENFANQDFTRAFSNYKTAVGITRDNPALLMKAGYAAVSLGQYATAIEYVRRAVAIDPAVATYSPTPDDVYGENQIAWTMHLGRVTRWVAEDVRDSERVFLLGALLLLDGDTRAPEFLEKAWQLSGGTDPTVVAMLTPPRDVAGDAAGASDDPDVDAGPALGALPEGDAAPSDVESGVFEADVIPPAPDESPSRSERPYGESPLFPLPSETIREPETQLPPLPTE